MQIRSAPNRLRFVWRTLSRIEQFAIVALAALACGVLLSTGWGRGGVPQVAITVVELGAVVILLAIVGRVSEETAASRRVERDWNVENARLTEQNAGLRRQIDESHRRSVEINDMVLRRVGVELHDGPAQLIGLALLRLDCLRPDGTAPNGASLDDFERIRSALQEALAEIRGMLAGLTLPELSRVSAADVLRLAARNHERRTATSVTCEVEVMPQQVPAQIKSCLYRFAQEALNNAYRHAGGRGQTVRGRCRGNTIEVEVTDAGPGFELDSEIVGGRQGLLGMRERIASLGGTLEINSRPGAGTRLTTRFEMTDHVGNQG